MNAMSYSHPRETAGLPSTSFYYTHLKPVPRWGKRRFFLRFLLLPVHRCPPPPPPKKMGVWKSGGGGGGGVCTRAGLGEMRLKNLNTIGSYVGLIHIWISSSSIPPERRLDSRKGETKWRAACGQHSSRLGAHHDRLRSVTGTALSDSRKFLDDLMEIWVEISLELSTAEHW